MQRAGTLFFARIKIRGDKPKTFNLPFNLTLYYNNKLTLCYNNNLTLYDNYEFNPLLQL